MTCASCGTTCGEHDQFCATCGQPLARDNQDGSVTPTVRVPTRSGRASGDGTTLPTFARTAAASVATPPIGLGDAATVAPPTGGTTRGGHQTIGGPLQSGSFGPRYHIIKMLGAGGMGAVYHAWDEELGVAVALKVIRPEHLADPMAAADLERRFKRELVLARQITHKNVVRIHDLGDVGGIKYLTMPFIHGADLSSTLRHEGKVTVARTLRLARQMLEGLSAAHQAGVVHRDLKPANVMIDAEDTPYIMDFGIARSASTPSATMAGAVIGTMAYMAPEQARGEVVDQRADVYSFGLILRDMLVGLRSSAMGDSAVSELMARMSAAPSLKAVDAAMSDDLERIVKRCLEPDAARRYPDAASVLADISALDEYGRVATPTVRVAVVAKPRRTMAIVAAAVSVAAIAAGGWFWSRPAPPVQEAAVAVEPISLAVLPFRNASGDSTLDAIGSSIAEILRADLGESPHMRTTSAGRVRQTLYDLRVADGDVLSDTMLRRLSELTNSEAVIWGQILKIGNQIQLVASVQDIRRGGTPQTLNAVAANEAALLETIAQLANQVREHVAKSRDLGDELRAASLRPSTSSFAAFNEYNVGLELARMGNHTEAVKHFTIATQEDQEFGLAHARLALSYDALGYDEDAERSSRRATALADRASPYEKHLIEATHARVLNDTPKALAALEAVAKVSPNDTDILFELGTLYENSGQFKQAHDNFAKLLARDPKSIDALLANGRVLVRLQQANESLEFLTLALTLSTQLEKEDARANVLQALGIAYKQLDKPADAFKNFREALEIRRKRGPETAIAASLNEIGQVQNRMGQADQAIGSFQEALRIRRKIGDRRGIATVLINLGSLQSDRGQSDAALSTYREALQIQRDVGNQVLEAVCLNSIGSIYYNKGQYDDALTYYDRALALREKQNQPRDLADTLHNLGETAVRTGQFEPALAHYLRALDLRRKSDDTRGSAIESFSTGAVFEWQGRFGASVKARQEAYEAFRRLNDRSFWYGTILTGYALALSRSGRGSEAEPLLNEALQLARELKNDSLIAETISADGERLFLGGDVNGARARFEAALVEANKTSDRQLILTARLNMEKAAASTAPSAAGAARIATIGAEADAAGLKHLAMDAVVLRGETLIQLKQYDAAQRELERALGRIETLSLRLLEAKVHVFLAKTLDATGKNADARRHQTQALRLFEEVRKDAGTDRVLARSDLAAAYQEAQRGS
jgi:eukaryotic-like serine/threonine-protein kinase